jgi:N-acetylmuramoyl-L-alanine amidase
MRQIKYIVIHCSAGHGDLNSVKRWWSQEPPAGLGWKTGGYHKWVDYDGTVTDVYPLTTVTNGVKGFNSNAVHIAYRGGVEKGNVNRAADTRTEEQKAGILTAILSILVELKPTQDVSKIIIKGHRDFSTDKNGNGVIDAWERIKECPSFDAIPEYSWITL